MMIVVDRRAEADLPGVRDIVPEPVKHVSKTRVFYIVVPVLIGNPSVVLRIDPGHPVLPHVFSTMTSPGCITYNCPVSDANSSSNGSS